MRVLSLFDGISCARVALSKLNIPVEAYYASEIDPYAVTISKKRWPKNEHVGNVEMLRGEYFAKQDIDLLIGGSPCQDLSIAKSGRQGLAGARSGLFYEYVRLLKEAKPKYFILENVASMSKEAKEQITEIMGVEPIMIDAALVGAQQRKRLFWTNIPGVTQPDDRGIMLKDILESGEVDRDKAYCIDAHYYKGTSWKHYIEKHKRQLVKVGVIGKDSMGNRVYSPLGKSKTSSANGGGWGAKTGLYLIVPEATKKGYAVAEDGDSVDLSFPNSTTRRGRVGKKAKNLMTSPNVGVFKRTDDDEYIVRKLTPVECERLQAVPDGYTDGVSNTQRYKTLGNAFNADVIAHILSFIPEADRA